MELVDTLADFPLGFAETIQTNDRDNSIFYADWLADDDEFPRLSTGNNSIITEIHWELVDRDEFDKDDFVLVQGENDWSKINAFSMHTYLEVAGKNSDTLKLINKKSIHPNTSTHKHFKKTYRDECNDEYDYNFTSIYDNYKTRHKKALRSGHLRRIRDLTTLDCYYFDLLRFGTSESKEKVIYPELTSPVFGKRFCCKSDALKFISKFKVNRWYKYDNPIIHNMDYTEYSVLDRHKERTHVPYYSSDIIPRI